MTESIRKFGWRRWSIVGAGLAGAFIAGGLAVGVIGSATAQDQPTTTPNGGTSGAAPAQPAPGQGQGPDQGRGQRDESQSQRSDEHLLTGDDAAKARAAALAKYPGATIQRVETDSDGVYEAHLITSDGKRVTAEMDKNFAVTGEEAHGPR
jgi:hypothetical protein